MTTPKIENYEELIDGKFTETRIIAIKHAFKKFMIKMKKPKGSDLPDRMLTADIGTLFRMLNFNPLQSEIEKMMIEIDPDKEGTITFYQFLYLLWQRTILGEEEEVLLSFQVLDSDQDGILSVEELKRLLTKVGEVFDEEEMEAFALHADISESGKFDFEDFINRMNIEDEERSKKS